MDRTLLTVLLLAIALLAAYGLLVGWRHRAQRQSEIAQPLARPANLGGDVAEPLAGLYVSTTKSGSWQDRIVAHGLGRRAGATLRLGPAGIFIDRTGETGIFIPAADVEAIGTAPGIAGKVMGMPDGILVITWNLGGTRVDSGLRMEDLEAQAEWIDLARRLLRDESGTDSTLTTGTNSKDQL